MGSIEHMGEKTNNRVNDKYQNRKDVQEISIVHSLPENNNKINDKWKIILQNTRGLITPNSKKSRFSRNLYNIRKDIDDKCNGNMVQ